MRAGLPRRLGVSIGQCPPQRPRADRGNSGNPTENPSRTATLFDPGVAENRSDAIAAQQIIGQVMNAGQAEIRSLFVHFTDAAASADPNPISRDTELE